MGRTDPQRNRLQFGMGPYCFDYLLIFGYGAVLVVMSIVFQPFFGRLFASDPMTSQLAGFLLMTLPVVMYFIFCESSAQMGTFGKRKIGIKVVDSSGERFGKSTALIHKSWDAVPPKGYVVNEHDNEAVEDFDMEIWFQQKLGFNIPKYLRGLEVTPHIPVLKEGLCD